MSCNPRGLASLRGVPQVRVDPRESDPRVRLAPARRRDRWAAVGEGRWDGVSTGLKECWRGVGMQRMEAAYRLPISAHLLLDEWTPAFSPDRP